MGKALLALGAVLIGAYVYLTFIGGGSGSAKNGAGKATGDLKNHLPNVKPPQNPDQAYDWTAHLLAHPWAMWVIGLAIVGAICAWFWRHPKVLVALMAIALLAAVGAMNGGHR